MEGETEESEVCKYDISGTENVVERDEICQEEHENEFSRESKVHEWISGS